MAAAPQRPAVRPALYSRRHLERLVGRGDQVRPPAGESGLLRPRLARSLALANLRPGLWVVDVGCGRGEAAVCAARQGAWVVGMDFSFDALALSCETAAQTGPDSAASGAQRLAWVAAEATALPLAARAADRVLLLDVVEHLWPWQVELTLAEVRRILKPGGYVVIHTLPNRWALAFAYPLLRMVLPGLPRQARSAYECQVHVNEQDPLRLRQALHRAGLQARVWVEEWTTRHALWSCGLSSSALQAASYAWLRKKRVRQVLGLLMSTPLRWLVANDLFAIAWLPGNGPPPIDGRLRTLR